ncbi:uridine kinase [Planomicrobium stackebrandtii]|uniref:Uridine kinase n=1 Tax=Planomicrobium stackebrandtii TaxID=253160 RepID=A0ABU0H0J9_9BACL|nr:hypothetical protein [Planomicrobium stackebrandtii]MDQ0430312.1 uridine kinase [Planomicrobium stackebrandtii]
MKKSLPFVISIASVSGGGKTTIVNRLTQQFGNSKALYFDDYDFEGPDDILKWVDDGANSSEWNLTPLLKDLKSLLEEPLDYIIMDFPFAYQHDQISSFIDLAVFIDTPLDLALARRMKRDFAESSAAEILLQLEHYAHKGRRAYLEMLHTIKPNSDVEIDGALSIDAITDQLLKQGR